MIDQFVYEDENFIGALIGQRSHCRFDHIGNHANARFARLRTRSRISIIFFVNAFLLLFRALIEVLDATRPVMRCNRIANILGQFIFLCNFEPIALVRFQYECTHIGIETIMRIVAALILGKVLGIFDFSNVVIIAANAS